MYISRLERNSENHTRCGKSNWRRESSVLETGLGYTQCSKSLSVRFNGEQHLDVRENDVSADPDLTENRADVRLFVRLFAIPAEARYGIHTLSILS